MSQHITLSIRMKHNDSKHNDTRNNFRHTDTHNDSKHTETQANNTKYKMTF
jgi:hypothetical protein